MNTFDVGPPVRKPSFLCFTAGQPLGYYGSWALFALSHHYVVWLAARRACPNRVKPFSAYALLGDDIVIADKEVAHHYQVILDALGVSISAQKSLVSYLGALEFAKQYWVGERNLSPISCKALLVTRSVIGLAALASKYSMEYSSLIRLAGGGYRVLGNMERPRGKRWLRLRVISDRLKWRIMDDLDRWLGGNMPLNPYIRGKINHRTRRSFTGESGCQRLK